MFREAGGVVAAIDVAVLIVWGGVVLLVFLFWTLRARYAAFSGFLDRSEEALKRWRNRLLLFWTALLPGMGIYALSKLAAPDSLWTAVPIFFLLAGAVVLLFRILSTDEKRRRLFDHIGKVASGFAVPTVLAWTFLSAALGLFGSLTFVLYELDAAQLRLAQGTGALDAGIFADFYAWHLLDAIPLLRVPETLRLEVPATYESSGVGCLLLAFKLFVIIPVVGIFRSYWQFRKQRSEAGAKEESR